MADPFSRHVTMGQPVQFTLNEWHQAIESLRISVVPGQQQLCDRLRHASLNLDTVVRGEIDRRESFAACVRIATTTATIVDTVDPGRPRSNFGENTFETATPASACDFGASAPGHND